ncbi:lipase member H-like [Cloeon dipterum]|uniref:lipase member H-like n=1 Tax=Cloeon dipterum TaxID=197152 RepID=UPI003220872E
MLVVTYKTPVSITNPLICGSMMHKMRFHSFFGLLAASLAVVSAAPRSIDVNEREWIIYPSADSTAHLALLQSAVTKPVLDNPDEQITFFLFTRNNRNTPQQIWVSNLNDAFFDPTKSTKFLVHGFGCNGFSAWVVDYKNKLLDLEDCNVIIVDWSGPAEGPQYNQARAYVQPTGGYVGKMYKYLDDLGHSLTNSHCIGFSLGAHVCGFSGKSVGGVLGRVTGLDPALPLFDYDNPESRLAVTDANYVDVIHTSAGWLSFEEPLGHADFYPNGGISVQPGCGTDATGACSQARAIELFAESITSDDFIAFKCDDGNNFQNGRCYENEKAVMGYLSRSSTRGSFFFITADSSPFALG